MLDGSSVVIAMKLWAGWSRVRITAGATVFPQNSGLVLKPIHPPIQLVSVAITPGGLQRDWLQNDIDHSMCLAFRLRINGATPLLPPQVSFISWTWQVCCQLCKKPDPKRSWCHSKILWLFHTSSKPPASKPTQWNLDFTFLMGSFKINVKLREWKVIFKTYFL